VDRFLYGTIGRVRGLVNRGRPRSVSLRLNIILAGPGSDLLCGGDMGK
jgi:hypothetical protein